MNKTRGNISKKAEKSDAFNFSICEMEKALTSKSSIVPLIKNLDDLEVWLNSNG